MPYDPQNPYHLTTMELRDNLAVMLDKVRFQSQRYLIHRRNTPMAALVMVHDLARVEELDVKSLKRKQLEMEIALEAWERAKHEGEAQRQDGQPSPYEGRPTLIVP